MALPYKEPSQVLAMLLDKIVEEGRKFASAADIQVADMSANSPVGTTLAILERTLKVMTAVQARIHYSLKQELGLLREVSLLHESLRVDANLDTHHHLVCTRCKSVTDLPESALAPLKLRGRLPGHFRAHKFNVEVQGLCARCASESTTQ